MISRLKGRNNYVGGGDGCGLGQKSVLDLLSIFSKQKESFIASNSPPPRTITSWRDEQKPKD